MSAPRTYCGIENVATTAMHTVRTVPTRRRSRAPIRTSPSNRRAASQVGFLLLARDALFERGDSLTKLRRRVADLIEEMPGGRQVAFFDLQ